MAKPLRGELADQRYEAMSAVYIANYTHLCSLYIHCVPFNQLSCNYFGCRIFNWEGFIQRFVQDRAPRSKDFLIKFPYRGLNPSDRVSIFCNVMLKKKIVFLILFIYLTCVQLIFVSLIILYTGGEFF